MFKSRMTAYGAMLGGILALIIGWQSLVRVLPIPSQLLFFTFGAIGILLLLLGVILIAAGFSMFLTLPRRAR